MSGRESGPRRIYWAAHRRWRKLLWHLRQPDRIVCAATGRTMLLDRRDGRAVALWVSRGDVNPKARMLWQSVLDSRPWQVVADVGCNHGEMLLSARLPPAAQLFAFEPNPRLAALLRRSCAANTVPVSLFEAAVGAETGTALLDINPAWSGGSRLGARGISVPVLTLAQALAGLPDGLALAVKIDVEGHERAVLAGLRPALARWSQLAMMLEVMHLSAEARAELAHEFDVLIAAPDGGLQAVTMADLPPDQLDVVLVRKGEAVPA